MKVKKIESISFNNGVVVYNIETADTHTYFCEGVLVHNCEVPNIKQPLHNATVMDLIDQVATAMSLHPEITSSKRINLHYARMGEPTFNMDNIISASYYLKEHFDRDGFKFHPVVSTVMPYNFNTTAANIRRWILFKNVDMNGDAGLQLSINTTNDEQRREWSPCSMSLRQMAYAMQNCKPVGRKFTLNFAVTDNCEICPSKLLTYFSPDDYIIKLTPMHKTKSAIENGLKTDGDYTTYTPYSEHEKRLRDAGYDVLVFIASKEEDESRITCGNAILSDGVL